MSDYRDKAAELRRQVVWASNEAIDIISQALLEAHNAGRAEERERWSDELDVQRIAYAGEGDFTDGAKSVIATLPAIRSIT